MGRGSVSVRQPLCSSHLYYLAPTSLFLCPLVKVATIGVPFWASSAENATTNATTTIYTAVGDRETKKSASPPQGRQEFGMPGNSG